MALDTRDKRSSAIGVTLPWRGMFPAPDGSLDQGDRQQAAFVYRGVLAGAEATTPLTARKLHPLHSPNPLWHVLTNPNPSWNHLLSQPDHVIELPE